MGYGGVFAQHVSSQRLCLHRQSSPLGICEAQTLRPELFPKNEVLFDQVLDHCLLSPLKETRAHRNEELQWSKRQRGSQQVRSDQNTPIPDKDRQPDIATQYTQDPDTIGLLSRSCFCTIRDVLFTILGVITDDLSVDQYDRLFGLGTKTHNRTLA